LHQTSAVVYCAVDSIIPQRGKINSGFQEFGVALDHASIPCVWVSSRTRLEMDEPRRRVGHNHPFIAEGGSGAYLPEGYFHLRPEKTVRLGRFTCIPAGEPQPAARDALESLSEETGVEAVSLRSLSPRELVQNSGLHLREAEMARQRDFDELFFFAGASDSDTERFVAAASERKYLLRQHGVLWSLAIGASVKNCVHQLSKLYERALRSRPSVVGISTEDQADELLPACDRRILLSHRNADEVPLNCRQGSGTKHFSLKDPDVWDILLTNIAARS
jgi:predicted mannosyl-3-phosphoglycerate phosphatase (HAD superfamily)